MRKLILIFALIPLMAFAQYGQRGAGGGGSTFYWSLTGQALKSDSLRIIQGSNMTITQSGNTVTFNGAAGAGSTANVRANVGWTAQGGTTATDTVATYYLINGKYQRQMWVDTDNDSVIIAPHALYMITAKDGSTILAVLADSLGRIFSGNPSGDYASLDATIADDPKLVLGEDNATAGTTSIIRDGSANQTQFIETVSGGTSIFNNLLGVTSDGTNTLTPTAHFHAKGGTSVEALRATTTATGVTTGDGFEISVDASSHATLLNNESASLILGTAAANRLDIQTPNSGNNWNVFQNTAGSGATIALFTNTTTGSTLGSDGFDVGIGVDEAAYIVQRENLPMYFYTNNTLRATIAAAGGVGIGATTEAQANRAKFNVLGRAANDTLAIWSNDGGGVVNDSSYIMFGSGEAMYTFNGVGKVLTAGSSDIGDWDGDAGYAAIGHVSMSTNNKALIQGGSGDTYIQSAASQQIALRVNGTTKVSVDTNGDLLLGIGVVQNNSAVSAGSDAFTGTAETDTVTISGAANTDLYWIQPTGAAAPSANDAMIVEALSTGFVVHRAASGTSGLTYNWKREKP